LNELARVRQSGFTLVELLTALAIIGVLATLLTTALSTAKRKARQTACTSNLRQISLALNMYLEDHEKRPNNFAVLVSAKYLGAAGALRCPEDKIGNWGGLVEAPNALVGPPLTLVADKSANPATDSNPSVPYSYLHPLRWDDVAWDRLMKSDPSAGIAVCQLHGLGKQNPSAPDIHNFQGLILRAQRDGAVVRRQIFWDQATEVQPQFANQVTREAAPSAGLAPGPPTTAAMTLDTAATATESNTGLPWQLFTDQPVP